MPLGCSYCGLNFWNATDTSAHALPCLPGYAPNSLTVGVPPGMAAAPANVPRQGLLAASASGLVTTGI